MKCWCGASAYVLYKRERHDGSNLRRHECEVLHRFSTIEMRVEKVKRVISPEDSERRKKRLAVVAVPPPKHASKLMKLAARNDPFNRSIK